MGFRKRLWPKILFAIIFPVFAALAAWIARPDRPSGVQLPADEEFAAQRAALAPDWLERTYKEAVFTGAPDSGAELAARIAALRRFLAALARQDPQTPPPAYARTGEWQEKLALMEELAAKAEELTLEGRTVEAAGQMAAFEAVYGAIRRENGLDRGEAEALAFYRAAWDASLAPGRSAAEAPIDRLRLNLSLLKEFDLAAGYAEKLVQAESALTVLSQSLDGPDFRRAQAEIVKTARELYLKY